MPNLVHQYTPDRPALVNQLLGSAFGVPGRGLLRPGQTIDALSAAETGQVLEAMRQRYPVARDAQTGWREIAPVTAVSAAADSRNPVARIWLQDVKNVRSALTPAFGLLRTSVCHPDFCRETIRGHVDLVELGFSDLQAAIADEEPEFLALGMIDGVVGRRPERGLTLLQRILSESDLGSEAVSASLTVQHQIDLLVTLKRTLINGLSGAELPLRYRKAEQCAHCIAEAISDTHAVAADLGLSDCDLEAVAWEVPVHGRTFRIDLAEILTSVAREWQLINQLVAKGGTLPMPAILRAATRAEKLSSLLTVLDEAFLKTALGLVQKDARQLASRFTRLRLRASSCASYLRTPFDGSGGGPEQADGLRQRLLALPRRP